MRSQIVYLNFLCDCRLKEKVTELKDRISAINPGIDYDEFHEVVSMQALEKIKIIFFRI